MSRSFADVGVSLPQRAWTALAGAAFVAFFATSCATAASSQTLFGGWFERDRVLFGQSAPYGQALPQTEQPNADGELEHVPPKLNRWGSMGFTGRSG